jgi:signal transduction histidine kinase
MVLGQLFPQIEQLQNKKQILIVDDDPLILTTLLEVLDAQYQTNAIKSGQAALDFFQNNHIDIDLLLLDLVMPDVDGFEVLTRLRQNPKFADLPIIILSAYSDPDIVVRGLALGANDFIAKPIQVSVLCARIETQLKLKQLLDERHQHIVKLQKTEQLRTQLSRIASHDLRNPLNNLRLAEQLLHSEISDNDYARQILKTVETSVDMMEHIISAFVDLITIQTENIQLKQGPVQMRDVINNALAQYEIVADKKNIHLMIETSDGLARADSKRMIQIVGNLISNAIKYSPHDSDVRLWTTSSNGYIRLSIADNGPGIPIAERHLLFKEFSKLSTRPTADESRTGLGLWIVKHLTELQGGVVGVDFPADGGSIFWIELPVMKA